MGFLRGRLDGFALFKSSRLFDAAMECFDLPAVLEVGGVVIVISQREIVSSEIGNVAVRGDQLTHEYGTKLFQPDRSHLSVGECQVCDGEVGALLDADQTIRFEIADEMPVLFHDVFQVLHTGIPSIHQDIERGKASFLGCIKHIFEVIVLGEIIVLFPVDAVVDRYVFLPIRPEKIDDTDAVHQSVFGAGILFTGQGVLAGEPFVDESVVADKIASSPINEVTSVLPEL